MKIVFIEPRSPGLHIFSKFGLPRLGAVLLATIAKERGHEASVFVEEIAGIDWEEVLSADLVGVSTITSTAPRAYALADRVRARGVKVVIGGPHASSLPEEAALHADFVLTGEAENTLLELLEHIQGSRAENDVHGMVRLAGGAVVRTAPPEGRVDIDRNPASDFSLIRGWSEARGFLRRRIVPLQVSRGCPFDCSFCSVTRMFGRRMRYRSTGHVMEELLRYNDKNHLIFFYDDNFAASPERAKELLRAMKEARTSFVWSTQVRADAARDEELLQLMRDTHCDQVYIGVESVNPESLRQANKRQDAAETLQALLRFRRYGIDVHGMFVVGFDADTTASAKAIVRYSKKARLTSIQALLLTPLPGSTTFEKLSAAGRILFGDWSMYDGHHVVFSHPNMNPEQLQKVQLDAHNKFYSKLRILYHTIRLNFTTAAIALYARSLYRNWKKGNRLYLKALKLLTPSKELEVKMELRKPCAME